MGIFDQVSLLTATDVSEPRWTQKAEKPGSPMDSDEVEVLRCRLNWALSELKMLEHFCGQFDLPVNVGETWMGRILCQSTERGLPIMDAKNCVLLALQVAKESNMQAYNRYSVNTESGVTFYFKFRSSYCWDFKEFKRLAATMAATMAATRVRRYQGDNIVTVTAAKRRRV